MEGLLIGYGIFCLTTAITAAITLFAPTLSKLMEHQPDNVLVEYKSLSFVVFTIMAILVAPLLFFPSLAGSDKFKDSLYNSVKD